MGLLWLSTVPPTVALCARNFGTRWLATIFGMVFLGHQFGGFTGAWLGGVVFDRTGSYDLMWVIGILGSVAAALASLAVRDGPAPPPRPRPAAVVAAEAGGWTETTASMRGAASRSGREARRGRCPRPLHPPPGCRAPWTSKGFIARRVGCAGGELILGS